MSQMTNKHKIGVGLKEALKESRCHAYMKSGSEDWKTAVEALVRLVPANTQT